MRADKLSIIGPINWGDLQINRFSDQLVIQSVVGGTSSIIGSLGGTTGPQGFQGPTGSGGGGTTGPQGFQGPTGSGGGRFAIWTI
jgi:hypothetical protein